MPRISKKNKYSWTTKLILWAQKKKYGASLNPAYYWGRSSWLMLGLQFFYRCLDRKGNPIDKKIRALISHKISELNNCQFCSSLASSSLKKMKSNPQPETEKEKVAVQYAEEVTLTGSPIKEENFQKLKEFFSEDEIVELTAFISFQNMSSKFNAALDIPPQDF